MKLQYLLLVLLFVPLCLSSQDKVEAGLFLGESSYGGDLVEPNIFFGKGTNFGFGILGRYHLNENLGLRGNFLFGKMTGDDRNYADNLYRAERDISFESSFAEFSVMAEFEPFGHKRHQEDGSFKKIFSPYIFTGLGAAFTNPEADYSKSNVNGVVEDQNNSASNTQITIPIGFGVKYDLSQKINLGLEIGARPTFTDYLDGVSITGNPDRNDWYLFGGLVLSAKLGNSDKDGDGITDNNDSCPEVPGSVDLKGCPDTDSDGITDAEDVCPNIAGLVKLSGCPDADGDGIKDSEDACPDEPGSRATGGCPDGDGDGIVDSKDECPYDAGLVSFSGCPDSDSDGIADKDDACPNEAGTKAKRGCPERDSDGDGVMDEEDDCPNTKGLVTTNGCPDSDADGVIDELDKCPTVAGSKTSSGCPEIKKEDKTALDLATQSIEFETGKARIKRASFKNLDQISSILKKYPSYTVAIKGHTDSQGAADSNKKLSENRAKACFDYLTNKGIKTSRMSHQGFGESQPIADNKTEAGRKKNRRVEFDLSIK